VLLRYYEGLTSQQIAARQGVSDGTVRWRLKQALAQLRLRLDGNLRAFMPLISSGGTMLPALKLTLAVAAVVAGVGAVAGHFIGGHSAAPPSLVATPAPQPAQSAAAPTDDALQRAQDAYIHGEYDDAIELAQKAKATGEDSSKAWRIIGAASCFKQDAVGASEAWNAVDPPAQKFIEYVCKRNDVTLPDGKPVL
jgi:hypothetical protein